jgi:hypothetical protein
MSTKAGAIQGSATGTTWTGGWVAALLLTAILVLALFAVNRSNGVADRAPAKAGTAVSGQQLSGGRNVDTSGTAPARQPIVVNGTVCYQCR